MEEGISFRSDAVTLEGRLSYEEDSKSPLAKVLLCPPHPFLGGDMDNNVVRRLTHTLAGHNFLVFRFNYRGIGKSTTDRDLQQDLKEFWENSTCPDYEAKIHLDCHSALQLLQQTLDPDWPVVIIGYSFGCLPAIELTGSNDIKKLVLISPPLAKWKIDMNRMQQDIPKAIFFSPDDFACPEHEVTALYHQLPEPKLIRSFPDAEHFFIGKETGLADAIHQFLVQ
ncbi:MAG: hypothetical protein A2W28_04935 [Gammaproteobacteria bacterium RBG_16_51_14]|nr:MAG: hypothetical protein A2W28_04935 [Gammaproteobacteria bacterium RBG_16_51_14]